MEPLASVAVQPISIVTVAYSNALDYNLLRSECVADPANQVIVVDNAFNLFFESLGLAITAGLTKVRHDIVVFVHEDVLLPNHWQQHLFSPDVA